MTKHFLTSLLVSMLIITIVKLILVQSVPVKEEDASPKQKAGAVYYGSGFPSNANGGGGVPIVANGGSGSGGGVPIVAGPVSQYTCYPYTGNIYRPVSSFYNGCSCNKAVLLKSCPPTNTYLPNCPRNHVCQCVYGSQMCYNLRYGK